MADLFEDYKPLRNFARKFELKSSLLDLWVYFCHIDSGAPLPDGFAAGARGAARPILKGYVFPWDLDNLAREIILNAGATGERSLRKWKDLATGLDHIRRLDGLAFGLSLDPQSDVMIDLLRMMHRQIPWQAPYGVNPMMRVFKIYGAPAVETVVLRETGMTTRQLMLLGTAISGHFLKKPVMSTDTDYSVIGVTRAVSEAFLKRITCTIENLRKEIAKRQAYDRNWLYTWNPLEGTPLVRFDPERPDLVVCPIPFHLRRRVSFGLYYDLVKASGFDNPFGDAFQAYVGEILARTCRAPDFTIHPETEYYVGQNLKHGADWILSDGTGHLFIECKTKRLVLDSKTRADTASLTKDLHVLAEAIIQHYRNVLDALDGRTAWKPDGRPVYPLIILLEDWFLLSPAVREMLDAALLALLPKAGLPPSLLEEMPYTVASANELETAAQIVTKVGIANLFAQKTSPAWRESTLMGLIATKFVEEMQHVDYALFLDEWQNLTGFFKSAAP